MLFVWTVFFALRLDGIIAWSWPIVFSPLFASCGMYIVRAATLLVPRSRVLQESSALYDPKVSASLARTSPTRESCSLCLSRILSLSLSSLL